MFIAFTGKGWLVPITAIGAGIVCAVADLRDPRVFWPVVGLSGLVDHYFGKRWNTGEGRLLQDVRTGEVMEVKPNHSFFWIPMQYWLFIKLALAATFVYIAVGR
ncbi:MAG: hypothetical protein R2817_07005 [Flavobacteriales bacterium]